MAWYLGLAAGAAIWIGAALFVAKFIAVGLGDEDRLAARLPDSDRDGDHDEFGPSIRRWGRLFEALK